MGIVQFGAPEDSISFLREQMDLKVFVEGGTYQGGTARWASSQFEKVLTIENSREMHCLAKQNLEDIPNVTLLLGDTRTHLPEIVEQHDDLLYWLDAHWSGGVTYGEGDECPLLEEFETIFAADRNQVILVDDARLFLAPPPKPHRRDHWPTLIEIVQSLPQGWDLVCDDDVFYVLPESIAEAFREFHQSRPPVTVAPKPGRLQRLKSKLIG